LRTQNKETASLHADGDGRPVTCPDWPSIDISSSARLAAPRQSMPRRCLIWLGRNESRPEAVINPEMKTGVQENSQKPKLEHPHQTRSMTTPTATASVSAATAIAHRA